MTQSKIFHLGVDWAKRAHYMYLTGTDGKHIAPGRFAHSGQGMIHLQEWLQEHTAGGEIIAVIERPHGAIVEALQALGVAVYAVNPKQLCHTRESRAPRMTGGTLAC